MPSRLLLLALAVLPAAAFAAPAPLPRPERRQPFVPPDTLEDLVRIVEKRGEVRRGAVYLKPKYAELEDLEKAYKPRRRGGAGVGPPSNSDGIEFRLYRLQRNALKNEEMQAQRDELLRAAHYVVAVTEVARQFAPDKVNHRGKGAKEWDAFADETVRAAHELAAAARAGDATRVRAAAAKVTEGCIKCHEEFRD